MNLRPPAHPGAAGGRVLERFTWIAAVILVLGTLAFLGIAEEVAEGDTLHLDERILMAMRVPGDRQQPIGPAWLEEAFRDFTGLGGVGVLGLVTLATLGYLWLRGRRRAALYVLLAIGGGLLISLALKAGFHRPRPDLISHGSVVATASFPSGHTMLSAIVYLTAGAMLALVHEGRAVRIYLIGCALLFTVLVGVSRVYLGVHWPTDVLAGWARRGRLGGTVLGGRQAPTSPRAARLGVGASGIPATRWGLSAVSLALDGLSVTAIPGA